MIVSFLLLQFGDVVPFCEAMADQGKVVLVAALDGTYQRQVGTKLTMLQQVVFKDMCLNFVTKLILS